MILMHVGQGFLLQIYIEKGNILKIYGVQKELKRLQKRGVTG